MQRDQGYLLDILESAKLAVQYYIPEAALSNIFQRIAAHENMQHRSWAIFVLEAPAGLLQNPPQPL